MTEKKGRAKRIASSFLLSAKKTGRIMKGVISVFSDKQKEIMEELKAIVLELHRSAGDLDEMIQKIESEAYGRDKQEIEDDPIIKPWFDMLIRISTQHRLAVKKEMGYDALAEKEEELLFELMNSTHQEDRAPHGLFPFLFLLSCEA